MASSISLPVGWEHRTNGAYIDPNDLKSVKAQDWSQFDPALKYKHDVDSEGSDPNLPIGFSIRHNTKTLQELSNSGSAAAIAVAEVHQKESPDDFLPILGMDYKSGAKEEQQQTVVSKESFQLIKMMSEVMMQMNERMTTVEKRLETLTERTDSMLQMQLQLLMKMNEQSI